MPRQLLGAGLEERVLWKTLPLILRAAVGTEEVPRFGRVVLVRFLELVLLFGCFG